MKWNVITDPSCNLYNLDGQSEKIRFARITGFFTGKLGFLGIGIGSEQGTI